MNSERRTAGTRYTGTSYSDWHSSPSNVPTRRFGDDLWRALEQRNCNGGGTISPNEAPNCWGQYASPGTEYRYTRVPQCAVTDLA